MTITNFKLVETRNPTESKTDILFIATVDIKTGFLFWSKTKTRMIAKRYIDAHWRFLDTGGFTPNHQVEDLAWIYGIKNNIQL
ncbi:MAG: hypothetical protein KGL39_08520 [Patescibacteria group bacterium]|nr:hypothetical protein [Patescibacteria group bacterium]